MLMHPSRDELLKNINSAYSLCVIAAKRARRIRDGEEMMLDEYQSVQPVGKALEEIAHGDILIDPKSQTIE